MNRPKESIQRARALRKEPTWPEKALWSKLRSGQAQGLKFRRQHSVLGHILDFACVAAKVGVEIDGASHEGERAGRDKRKEQVLRDHGWEVLRFTNKEVANNLDAVAEQIANTCVRRIGE